MRRVPALICLATMLLPAACTTAPGHALPRGTVTGTLIREGGPYNILRHQQAPSGPIPGTVRFTSGHHRVITIRVSKTGSFSGQLPSGRYSVSYRSPRLLEGSPGSARQTWSQPVSVTVTPHHTTKITLTAIVP